MDPELQSKVQRVFGPLVVDKRQALQVGFELMPRFVTEYLLAAARARNDALGLGEVRERIQRHWVDADRKNEFVSRLMRDGQAQVIALLDVEARPERNEHVGRIPQLDGHELGVSTALVERFPEVLYGGLWGSCSLAYDLSGAPRIQVVDFTPYQLTRPDMEQFRRGRSEFSLDEWLQLLISSAGYRPEAFPTTRHRLLALARLVPLVQRNVNLLELGARGTGKSYLLRSLSARSYLLAGARATPAKLLYDLARRQLGIVGTKKVVVFDEIAATQFPDRSLVAALKDFMESGHIARGGRQLVSECSLVLCGNIELDGAGGQPSRGYAHLLEVLPDALRDPALADRLHGFIPGWELPKIADDVLADGPGFLSDYFGEVLHELRRDLFAQEYLRTAVRLEAATQRDAVAVERLASGLLKMLFPDGQIEEAGLREVLQVAVELRQRVHCQLSRMAPGEFKPKTIRFPGMPPHVAADLATDRRLEDEDVEVNQADVVGKITILTVSSRGGGDVGFVECAQVDAPGDFRITGLRGQVLEESVLASYQALLHCKPLGVTTEALRRGRLSVHLVNMAEPKDGSSAGLAFALAMLSAVTRRPIRRGFAVTGELSIHGNVGAVGGIPEKMAAAARHGRAVVVIPAANALDVQGLTDVVEKVRLVPVRTLEQAVRIAFDLEDAGRASGEALGEIRRDTPGRAVTPSLLDRLARVAEPLPPDRAAELSERIEDHLVRVAEAREEGKPVDVELARRLAGSCHDLLAQYPRLPPEHQALVVGAIRYFVDARDEDHDLESERGLADDDTVISYVRNRLGTPDR